jgi:alkylated DNA repair protein alkB homolog 6
MSTISSAPTKELENHLISSLPPSIYYIPHFLPSSTCDTLLTKITSIPPQKWTNLAHRRLLSLPSPLTGKTRDTLLLSSSLPIHLTNTILPKFEDLGVFINSPHGAPNHVLVNEYVPGQGIMPHEDGPAYHPVTATVSLGSSIVLDIYSKPRPGGDDSEREHWRVLQEPGSLLVTTGECYTNTLHGIAELEVDEVLGQGTVANWDLLGCKELLREGRNIRRARVSLTYRDVRKVVKMGGGAKNSILGKQ